MLLNQKKIFIVEDNLSNRAISQMLLEQQGARTAIDRWGLEACTRLERFGTVDLIILDLMFPGGVTGFDIFDEIRSHPEFRHVPIVAVSAADPSEAVPHAKAKGFTGFISKPVDFNQFAQQIADIIEGVEVWEA